MAEPEPGFDRQAFVTKRERPREQTGSFASLLLLFGIALLAVAGFLYVRANGLPELGVGASNPDLSVLIARLEAIEQRLAELEKRRSASAPKTLNAPAEETSAAAPPSPSPSQTSAESPGAQAAGPPRPAPASPGQPADDRSLRDLQKQYSGLRTEVTANREAWDASAQRLGRVVGELGDQRTELADNREKLGQLLTRFDRTPIAFELRKGTARQRVGPVWLQLRRTDQRNHRYTLRVFLDEKWIEVKDRALLEPVELYLTSTQAPLELVVTEIRDDRVSGSLAVPRGLSQR